MLTAATFLIAYFLSCVLALTRHPSFGLLAYLSAFYIHPPSRWWAYALPDVRWSLLAAGVTFVGLFIHKQKTSPARASKEGLIVGNVDAVVLAQEPSLKNFKQLMKKTIAEILDMDLMCVNIKATTNEGMGFIGRKEGVACYATVSLTGK